ncbi:hypothetical protein ACYB6H_04810 [Klebsiella pneumoniae]|uniref:hypothetical protein n=1 Tax=Klebsiella pneumoniae TaxID=573 RepID=UPI0013DDF379|nr:hypothetical protein [Klebsiella pneumoniae]EKU2215929.1 hypothetical protein [Klebsiella pneumoniae]EKU2235370.1 hypothetical protein [Klebsiella pneumoniae]EKV3267860.1 hypothetical protein [Klebsiella pneumoniae]MBC4852751.1 hypothetical protein [Klebsiella pneumoniae]NGN55321.1 hypothetical protein [Klebsiella pneumoniae]
MNNETVNELIASLESAGELSIREQKFLKLAKAFRICSASLDAAIKTGNVLADQNSQLAAENVALKSKGKELLGEACAVYSRLNKLIDPSIGDFVDGQTLHEFQFVLDVETPATDRIVAGIKADGVEEFAAHLVSMECHLEAEWAKSFVLEVLNVKGR